jgi:phage shock protein PspC (stress-responsive transcriptional regulator)
MENNTYRRLTRSTTDRKIAGVCGGIAKYLNVDPTVVRIIFLLALICGVLGLWAYLIIWIAAPEDNQIDR